jgi:hypothetical protein
MLFPWQNARDEPWNKYVPNAQSMHPPAQRNGTYSMAASMYTQGGAQPQRPDNALVRQTPMVHADFGYPVQAAASNMGVSAASFPANTSSSQLVGQIHTETIAAGITAHQNVTQMQAGNNLGILWMPRDSLPNVDLPSTYTQPDGRTSTYTQPDGRNGNQQSAHQVWIGQNSLSASAIMCNQHPVQNNTDMENDALIRVPQGGFLPSAPRGGGVDGMGLAHAGGGGGGRGGVRAGGGTASRRRQSAPPPQAQHSRVGVGGGGWSHNMLPGTPSDPLNADMVHMSQLQHNFGSACQQNQMTMQPENTVQSYSQSLHVNVAQVTIPPLPNVWLPPLPSAMDDDMGAGGAVGGMSNFSNGPVAANTFANGAVAADSGVVSNAPYSFGGWHNHTSVNGMPAINHAQHSSMPAMNKAQHSYMPAMNNAQHSSMFHDHAGDGAVSQDARMKHHQPVGTHAPVGCSSAAAAISSAPANVGTIEHDTADLALVTSAFQLMSEEGKAKLTKKRKSKALEENQPKRTSVTAPPPRMNPPPHMNTPPNMNAQALAAANGRQPELTIHTDASFIHQLDHELCSAGNYIQKEMILSHLKQGVESPKTQTAAGQSNDAHARQLQERKDCGRGRGRGRGRGASLGALGGKVLLPGIARDTKDVEYGQNVLHNQMPLVPNLPQPCPLVAVDAGKGAGNAFQIMTGLPNAPAVSASSHKSAPPMRDIASIIEGMGGFKPAGGFANVVIGDAEVPEQSSQPDADTSRSHTAMSVESDMADKIRGAQKLSAGARAVRDKGIRKGDLPCEKAGSFSTAKFITAEERQRLEKQAARSANCGALVVELATGMPTADPGASGAVSSASQQAPSLHNMPVAPSSGGFNAKAETLKVKNERRPASGALTAFKQGAHSGSGQKEKEANTSARRKHVDDSLLRPQRWCGFPAKYTDQGKEEKKDSKGLPATADGKPLVLTQACMVVILYDSDRNVSASCVVYGWSGMRVGVRGESWVRNCVLDRKPSRVALLTCVHMPEYCVHIPNISAQ